VVTYPAPEGEVLSTNYTVEVDGKPVAVYLARTQHHDKRPYSFAYFDFSGTVTVKIKTDLPLNKPVVLPSKYGIKPTINLGEATFTTDKPFNISFEPTGKNIPLLLFSNPIEKDPPKQGDTNVIYFGPGMHKPTRIDLTSGQTLYIAGGAVVKTAVTSKGDNIRIMGRGILDGTDWPHSAGPTARMVWPADGRNILIQDLIIRGAWNWTVAPSRCDQVLINNIRICGSRCGNDDGIDPCNSSNVTIKNCFLRTDDDAIAVKGTAYAGQEPKASENIVVTDCTFWVDFANGFRIGAESQATGCRNFTARNIDFIHFPNRDVVQVFHLHPGGNMPMENLVFENIRINGESPLNFARLTPMKSGDRGRDAATNRIDSGRVVTNGISSAPTNSATGAGTRLGGRGYLAVPGNGPYIHNVVFRNVEVYGEKPPVAAPDGGFRPGWEPATGAVFLQGLSEKHNVHGVAFENVTRYGQLLTANSPDVEIGDYVSGVEFTSTAATSQPAGQPVDANPVSR
jgi:Glycosyl hydrolases family 28